MDETRGSGMVQDSGGSEEERFERDQGWQEFAEVAATPGFSTISITLYDYPLEVIYSFEEYYATGEPVASEYVLVQDVYIGDTQKIFKITELLGKDELEDLALKIEGELRSE